MKGKLQKMIQEVLGIKPDKVNIIPHTIPLETQLAYFETSKKVKENINYDVVLNNASWLFNPDVSIEDKKWLLAQLASISKPEAYRIIENFVNTAEAGELSDWAKIALIESRMVLESYLLDENQVIVSSGLGGDDSRLRYFVVFKKNDNELFTEAQIKLVEIESQAILENNDGLLEEFNAQSYYISLLILLPINADLKSILIKIVNTCNEYGSFLYNKYLITNVKKLSHNEILHFLKKFDKNES
ncbi:MAG: hypothetical protein HPY79_10890 [Bacteroidales bacterium]|nr:hypothetical protein [Bacteroidales bacterium]